MRGAIQVSTKLHTISVIEGITFARPMHGVVDDCLVYRIYSVLQVSSATCHEGVVAQNEVNPTPETKSPVCSHNEWDPLEVSWRP